MPPSDLDALGCCITATGHCLPLALPKIKQTDILPPQPPAPYRQGKTTLKHYCQLYHIVWKFRLRHTTEAELNQPGAWLERANFTSALIYEDDYIKNESILLFVFKVFKQWIILRKHESTQWCLINNQFVSRNLHGHFTKHKRQVYTDHKIIVDF